MAYNGIIKINANDVAYYLQCPMRFKLDGWARVEPKKAKPTLVPSEYVNETLAECVRALLMRHAFDGEAPALGSVIRLWNDAWKHIYEMYGKDESMADLYIKSTFKLQTYYHNHISKTKRYHQVPLMYDYKFAINYDNVDLVGHVDFGFFDRKHWVEEISIGFIGDITSKIGDSVRTNYNILSAVYKFREDFKLSCDSILYYNSRTMKWMKIDIPYTTEQLYSIIYDVCRALHLRVGYRNPGPYCKACKYNKNTMCEF